MVRFNVGCVAAVIYVGFALAPLTAQTAVRRVAGTVTDAVTGQSVAGVRVIVQRGGQAQTTVITGRDGAFDLQADDPKAVLEARAVGYAVYRRGFGTANSGLILRLERPATLSGTVINAGGERLATGDITVITDHPGNVVVKTGKIRAGRFTLNGLLSGPTTVTFRAEGLAPVVQQFDVAAGRSRAELAITMVPGGTIRGRVVDRDGHPVVGARLSLRYGDGGLVSDILAGFVQGRPVTGEDGTFYMKNLQPGRLMTIMASSGRAQAGVRVQLATGEERPLEIAITSSAGVPR